MIIYYIFPLVCGSHSIIAYCHEVTMEHSSTMHFCVCGLLGQRL